MALITTVQAQTVGQRSVSRPMTVRHSTAERATVAPSVNRSVARTYNRGGSYYRGGRYYGGYYNRGPVVSVGVGGVYDYPGYYGYGYPYAYDYGYGYPYAYNYGYTYPSNYYDEYPATSTTTTYTTSRYGDLAYDDNIVVAVQERLKRAGYYLGAIDGVAGPETRSAIARWEGNHGMYADGLIDQKTLHALGISV